MPAWVANAGSAAHQDRVPNSATPSIAPAAPYVAHDGDRFGRRYVLAARALATACRPARLTRGTASRRSPVARATRVAKTRKPTGVPFATPAAKGTAPSAATADTYRATVRVQ